MAEELDVVDNTVRNQLQKFEDEGVIEGCQANESYDRPGQNSGTTVTGTELRRTTASATLPSNNRLTPVRP